MSTVIEISNLNKTYGNNRAVNNISFQVQSGEILGFLGPNGAGKSTTMNILTGYLSSDSGTVKVCGYDVLENPKEVKRHIGYLPEQPPLYFEMTPLEYLEFVCDLKDVKKDRRKHISDVMETVGIDKVAGRLIKNLSKGYKQRVGLAGALIGNPEVLVLDEPTVGLDPRQIIEIRNVIKALGKNRTIILSTHILQEVSAVCDRVVIINNGKIAAEDTLDNLAGIKASTRFILRLKTTHNEANSLIKQTDFIGKHTIVGEKEPGTVDVIVEAALQEDIRERLYQLFTENNMPILSFRANELSLEDIFIKVTNQQPDSDYEEELPKEVKKPFFMKRKEGQ